MHGMYYCYFESPVGKLLLAGEKDSLSLIGFSVGKMQQQPKQNWQHKPEYFHVCMQQLQEYFEGKRKEFTLTYDLAGTIFQRTVLNAVAKVPYGTTSTYSAIASEISRPKAVRAVGMANARNNLPIIVPCHRIVGKNGALTGFGGGLENKRILLSLER